ncbi:MAG: hypothetical protein ABI791_14675 [Acidobacteriota bacterium]
MIKYVISAFAIFVIASVTVPAQTVVPIVEMKFRGLMGGVQNGKWVPAGKIGPRMKKQAEFVLVGANGVEEGGVTYGKKGETEDVCQDFFRFEFDLKMDAGVAIGTAAKWNLAPRLPRKIDASNATYKTVVSDFLKKHGIVRPIVKIKQALRVDLEGDGVDEVLLAATYYKNGLSSSAAAGDYSFVLLRKAAGKKVNDYLLKGDFVTKKVDFGAPTQNEISAIADLNGDGKMEIVLFGFYYEGDFASAFEMRNGRPVEIKEFAIGCGV